MRTANRGVGIFTHDEERKKLGDTRKEQRYIEVGQLLGEHLITACDKAGLNAVFANFAGRMQKVNEMFASADAMHGLDETAKPRLGLTKKPKNNISGEMLTRNSSRKRRRWRC